MLSIGVRREGLTKVERGGHGAAKLHALDWLQRLRVQGRDRGHKVQLREGEAVSAAVELHNRLVKPSSRSNSSVVYVGSPAANEESASAMARASTSVNGSSSTGALSIESSTGSNCSAGGMSQVCLRPTGLHRQGLPRTEKADDLGHRGHVLVSKSETPGVEAEGFNANRGETMPKKPSQNQPEGNPSEQASSDAGALSPHLEQLERVHSMLARLSGFCGDEHIARAARIAATIMGSEILAAEHRKSGDENRRRQAEHIEHSIARLQTQLYEYKWDKLNCIRWVIATLDDSASLRDCGVSIAEIADQCFRHGNELPLTARVRASIEQWSAVIQAWQGWNPPRHGGTPLTTDYRANDLVYSVMHGCEIKVAKSKVGNYFSGFEWP
jgi:hypothetical protein